MSRSFGDEVASRVGVIAEPGKYPLKLICQFNRDIGARHVQG